MSINLDSLKRKAKRTYKNLKAKLSKKRTRRKILAATALLLLVILTLGLTARDIQAERRAKVIQQKHIELQNIKETLEYVEKQKANTEHELKLKQDAENQLKQQVEQLNKDLQAKRKKPTRLANARPTETLRSNPKPIQAQTMRAIGRAAIGGNGYTPGQCTWHVKNLKADLPNNLGNANQWARRARAQGIPVGNTPRVGAAGMRKTGNHVVYVLQVRGSEVLISEMNYNWRPYAKRTIWKPANLYIYIY